MNYENTNRYGTKRNYMKLQLKHLAGYLPYGLKIKLEIGNVWDYKIVELKGRHLLYCKHIKPILRPLSDLTKEIEVNGEKFVPLTYLENNTPNPKNSGTPAVCFTDNTIEMCYQFEYEKLYEWHFDIHNLIENNLAIDVNTLKE